MSVLIFHKLLFSDFVSLIQQQDIVIGLSVTVFIFLILLVLGIRKTHKLKLESDRLANLDTPNFSEDDNKYKDFTEGHLYSND